jgi:uncharacterized protein Yka (UPF0111/DUF47 family)
MRKPRLAVHLAPDIKATYEYTAGLMGIPASRFIATLLTESEPSIKALQKPLEQALTGKQEALTGISELMDDIKEQADEHQYELLQKWHKDTGAS